MPPINPLSLSARRWEFLSNPDRYVAATEHSERKLVVESTRRQFLTANDILARLNGSFGKSSRRGLLLADDVGLGKTPIAALVAWVVASAGDGRSVRILAPNNVMMRRWEEELLAHVEPLQKCASHLDVRRTRVKVGKVGKLRAGSIQVAKHSYAASKQPLKCSLLIIDEAHRAKGDKTEFRAALKKQRKHADRVLILTATPFSIRLEELVGLLDLIDAPTTVKSHVRTFSRALDDLYFGNTARRAEAVAGRLAAKAAATLEEIAPFVIRHAADDLPLEQHRFGARADWPMQVPHATAEEEELILRMDRALRIAGRTGAARKMTNDPRFHVGWRHYDSEVRRLMKEAPHLPHPIRAVSQLHLAAIKHQRQRVTIHSKIFAVAEHVKRIVGEEEKVVLFCHHHATAQELAAHLHSTLPEMRMRRTPARNVWEAAWKEALAISTDGVNNGRLRDTFIRWLCCDLIRAQTSRWLDGKRAVAADLASALNRSHARRCPEDGSIAEAARHLYGALVQSRSSRAVLKEAEGRLELLPGASGASRVLAVCNPSEGRNESDLFIHNQQPDTAISIFNSPFGPDVLIATDKLSEGIDLHRYCRHLVHYELDPSPIRTVQRNGRLRRVNSWAALTGQPIRYAYPAFGGTRDHRLVQIMKKRIDSFSLLLGGVQDFDVDQIIDAEEKWRNDVIQLAKSRLAMTGRRLCARDPQGTRDHKIA
ncbi:Helicase conserved C-terminal domain-containing protein [Rhodospirillales bacterium URHD0017]|nr:Helicase conserved C-terminal domain-containing protein [Rhodospirillales bacterium URHD0017]